jgi:sugar (pentulose or hexulose) kinase
MDTRSFTGNSFALVGTSLGGGVSYQWLRDEARKQNAAISYADLDRLATRVPPGANGLVYCTGPSRRSPNRKQGFYGNLAEINDIGHRARAVMEGVVMDLFDHYSSLREFDNNEIMVGGGRGLQKSETWAQLTADMFNKPIRILDLENVIFGASLLAALGTHRLTDLKKALDKAQYREVMPNPTNSRMYDRNFVAHYRDQIGHQ